VADDHHPATSNGADSNGSEAQERSKLRNLWLNSLAACLVAGVLIVGAFGIRRPGASLGVAALLAGGSLLTGGLLGFLFGVPRSQKPEQTSVNEGSKSSDADGAPPSNRYRPNTNLEEVSDWLTKILVGVGLTQLVKAPQELRLFGAYFGPALGGGDVGAPFAICVLLYFSVAGFLSAYLWTRLYLGGALSDADALARVERKLDAQHLQAQRDVAAIAAVSRQLQSQDATQDLPLDRLKELLAQASGSVRAQAFYQASGQRAANWAAPNTKPVMERTIPVFQSLVAADKSARYHENYGQLGYALKDKTNPDWQGALEMLNTAIKMRGSADTYGYRLYEFNRILARIHTDPDFLAGRASQPTVVKAVRDDLDVARYKHQKLIDRVPEIAQWIALNP
jgi:hypothetical protein